MAKVLIAGGAGFLGSHLCERLVYEGNEVLCVDNFFTGSLENIAHLKDHKNFKVLKHDIIETVDAEVEYIYNLACPASPPHYQHDPIKTTKTSILGTLNLLELAKKNKATFMQFSTSEIYGDPEVHPQIEAYRGNVNTMGPRACYDEGKRCAETLCFEYNQQYQINVKVIRIFNTYGPRMHPQDGRVVSNFIMQALQGEDITVYGSGKQTRSFCYVNDLIEGIIRMMHTEKEFIGPVNLGNPVEFTILDLAQKVIEKTNSQSKIIYNDLPKDDPTQRKPDISLAKKKLAWEPGIHLDSGLDKTIEYFLTFARRKA